jgi:hypothetical protein
MVDAEALRALVEAIEVLDTAGNHPRIGRD